MNITRRRISEIFLCVLFLTISISTVVGAENKADKTIRTECSLKGGFSGMPDERRIWTVDRVERSFAGEDPIEGYNRCIFAFNDFVFMYIARPIGWVYCSILPKPVITCLDNFCENLKFPARAISSLCRAEWRGAGDETVRFLTNTTIGIVGLFDPAKNWFYFYPTYSTFGQAFSVWGIGPGCTFMLPILYPYVNVRDTAGALFDKQLDLRFWMPYTSWLTLNVAMVNHPMYETFLDASADRYERFRMLMVLNRELQQDMWMYRFMNQQYQYYKHPETAPKPMKSGRPAITDLQNLKGNVTEIAECDYLPQSSYSDSLRVSAYHPRQSDDKWYMPLSIFNSDFVNQGKVKSVEIPSLVKEGDSVKSKYEFWGLNKEWQNKVEEGIPVPEKLVIILPGIGSGFRGSSALATAELFNLNGYKAITVDSAFTWMFMEGPGRGRLPGYGPKDSSNMRDYLKLILNSLKEDGLIDKPEITIVGWSFGAVHTLHIAKLEEEKAVLNVNRFIGVNPPVDFDYAIRATDNLIKVSEKWNEKEIRDNLVNSVGSVLVYTDQKLPSYTLAGKENPVVQKYIPQVTSDQGKYLQSINMNLSIQDLLISRHRVDPLPGIKTPYSTLNRNEIYREISGINFERYAKEYVLPGILSEKPELKNKNKEDLYQCLQNETGLRSLESTLRNNPKIRVIHTLDDFLISEKDKAFLDDVLQKKMMWFNVGGHCGQFYLIPYQEALLNAASGKW